MSTEPVYNTFLPFDEAVSLYEHIRELNIRMEQMLRGDWWFESDVLIEGDLRIRNGSVRLDNTVWDDLRFPASALRLGGAAPADAETYKGGIVAAFATATDQYVYFTAQMPHDWKEGSDLSPHIHWTIPTDDGAKNVVWTLSYSWANIGDDFPAATTESKDLSVVAGNVDEHMLNSFTDIDGTGKTLSSMLLGSLMRDVSEDNYGYDAYLLEIDFHYEIDRLGSTTETDNEW